MTQIELPEKMQQCIDEFQHFIDKTIDKFSEENFLDEIYHYTSSEGLLGIIESEKLRLTHSSYLNDPTEILYGHEEIVNHANGYRKKSDKDKDVEYFWSRFSEPFCSMREKQPVFVCSFSCAKNDLTQWRSYANNGHGFCLEFNAGLFSKVPPQYMGELIIFNKLRYGKDSVKEIYDEIILKVEKSLMLLQLANDLIVNKFMEELAKQVSVLILYLGVLVKHPCYESEKEARLMCMGGKLIHSSQVRFSSQGNLIPYIEVDLPLKKATKGTKSILEKVWIGPTNRTEPDALRQLFISKGYPAEMIPIIEKSDLPYRVY